ncbi:MAG: flagellar motor protein MotB [Alphaproteobacteria bacterium]|nr:flagellar motor protein MotB [Alphaproteobacteria bacterium]
MARQYLALSLFIILLCFFLVLNAMSTFEIVKAQSVTKSLQFAFAGKLEGEKDLPSIHVTPTQSLSKGDSLDRIKALFSAQIKTFKASTNRMGTEMMVRLPVSTFEDALKDVSGAGISEQNAFEREGGAFLPTLVSLMQTAQSAVPYRLDILLNTPFDPADLMGEEDDSPQARELIRKASTYAAQLEKAGLPKKLVSSGLAKAEPGNAIEGQGDNYIELYFRRYAPVDPLSGERISGDE